MNYDYTIEPKIDPKKVFSIYDFSICEAVLEEHTAKYDNSEWQVGLSDETGAKTDSTTGAFISRRGYYNDVVVWGGKDARGHAVGVLDSKHANFIATFNPSTVRKLLEAYSQLHQYWLWSKYDREKKERDLKKEEAELVFEIRSKVEKLDTLVSEGIVTTQDSDDLRELVDSLLSDVRKKM